MPEILEQEINEQVAIIERSAAIFRSAPEILLANQERGANAIKVGKDILQKIIDEGMNPELDARAMKYMANCSKALTEMKEGRSEVTQIMDALKKMYTEVENKLDSKKVGTVPSIIQSHRDQYAKDVFAEQEKKRKEAELVAAKASEAIEIKFHLETNLMDKYNAYLLDKKQSFLNSFNSITLENFEQKSIVLKGLKPICKFDGGSYVILNSPFHQPDEIAIMHKEIVAEKLTEIKANYEAEISLAIDEMVDKLPSKLKELKEAKRIADEEAAEAEKQRLAEAERQKKIDSANAKEKERLEKEAAIAREAEKQRLEKLKLQQEQAETDRKKREQEESDRLAKEAEEKRQSQLQESEIKKQGEQTMAMFDKEAAIAENGPAPDARQGYEISILHAAGYVQVFQFWFENEGKNLPLDKLGNTKLDQMKAYCEKIAHKNGTMIESKFLKYEPTFKAVNKKSK